MIIIIIIMKLNINDKGNKYYYVTVMIFMYILKSNQKRL